MYDFILSLIKKCCNYYYNIVLSWLLDLVGHFRLQIIFLLVKLQKIPPAPCTTFIGMIKNRILALMTYDLGLSANYCSTNNINNHTCALQFKADQVEYSKLGALPLHKYVVGLESTTSQSTVVESTVTPRIPFVKGIIQKTTEYRCLRCSSIKKNNFCVFQERLYR